MMTNKLFSEWLTKQGLDQTRKTIEEVVMEEEIIINEQQKGTEQDIVLEDNTKVLSGNLLVSLESSNNIESYENGVMTLNKEEHQQVPQKSIHSKYFFLQMALTIVCMTVIIMTKRGLQQIIKEVVPFNMIVSCTRKVARMDIYDTLFRHDNQVQVSIMQSLRNPKEKIKKSNHLGSSLYYNNESTSLMNDTHWELEKGDSTKILVTDQCQDKIWKEQQKQVDEIKGIKYFQCLIEWKDKAFQIANFPQFAHKASFLFKGKLANQLQKNMVNSG